MFKAWLEQNTLKDFDFSHPLFPRAEERGVWEPAFDASRVAEAEKLLGFDWPVIKATDFMAFRKTGDRQIMETPHFARRRALLALVCGEILEYRGRFLPDIVNGLFAICEESFWGLSAHMQQPDIPDETLPYIDLFAAETGELLSVTCHVLETALQAYCPDILPRVRRELDDRILRPYLAHREWWWMGYGRKVNNWNPWILSNVLTVFLLCEKNRDLLLSGIRKIFTEAEHYYAGMPADGGCDEGCGYWGAAAAKLFELCDQVYYATDGAVSFFGDRKLADMGRYEYRAYIGKGWFANFADGIPRMKGVPSYALRGYGERIGDPQMSALAGELRTWNEAGARESSIGRALRAILMDKTAPLPAFAPEKAVCLPDLQNAFVREGLWYYAAKGGCNAESHNHNDVGSLIVFYDSTPVLIDPGCGTYTRKTFSPERYDIWTMQSGWHNLPAVNGCEQPAGAGFRADAFSLGGSDTAVSFAGAYPAEAGLTALQRRIGISAEGITVADAFTFTADANQVSERFITLLDAAVGDGRVILGGRYVLAADQPCRIRVDGMSFEGDPKLVQCWHAEGVRRVSFDFDLPKTAAIRFTLSLL